MKVLEGEQIAMRIFISESDLHNGKPLHHEIMKLLKDEKMAGATTHRGISGFGAKSHLHTAHLLTLSQDLPIIIEAVDTQQNIDRIIPKIDEIVTEGLITLEKVKVVRYAPKA